MRPLLACAISVSLLGGVYAYTVFANSVRVESVDYIAEFAEGEYSVEIRKSFVAAPDPIFSPESIKVLLKGEPVYSTEEEVAADETVEIKSLDGVETGENELYVVLNRKDADNTLAAAEVAIFRDGIPIAKTVMVSEPGLSVVSGSVVFTVSGNEEPGNDDEDAN